MNTSNQLQDQHACVRRGSRAGRWWPVVSAAATLLDVIDCRLISLVATDHALAVI